jgi:lysozyme
MNLVRTKLILEQDEGRVPYAYKDSLGYWTIGVGRLIDKAKGGRLNDSEIDLMLSNDIDECVEDLRKDLPWFDSLSDVRQAVLVSMRFNLGPEPFDHDGYKDWPIFVSQVKEGAYTEAAQNMRSTLWAKQVKGRSERLAKMMETDQWPSP